MTAVINTKSNFLFIHIPKTAGRSITDSLIKIDGSNHVDPTFEQKRLGHYGTLSFIENQFLQKIKRFPFISRDVSRFTGSLADWRKLIKFCVVRNPYDRAFSAFNYCKKTARNSNKVQAYGKLTPPEITFSEFIRLPPYYNYEIQNHFFITQTQYIQSNNCSVDYILKFESLNKDITNLESQLGLKLPALPNLNRSKKGQDESMSEEDKSLIRNMFREDFENFNYSF